LKNRGHRIAQAHPAPQIFPRLWPKTVLKVAGTLDGTCRCAMPSIWF
jgi:hypothetical protein